MSTGGRRTAVAGRFRASIEAHLESGRPDVACYVGLVGVAGVLLASDTRTVWHVVAAFLIPALVSSAAYYFGTYADREVDAVQKPDRPVPAKRMSARSALVGTAVAAGTAFVLAAVLDPVSLALVPVVVLVGAVYVRFPKARRNTRVFFRGAATLVVFGAAVELASGRPEWDLLLLGLVFWQQDSMLHQVLAIDHTEIDRRAGAVTLPVRYGHRAALWVLLLTLLFWFSSVAFQPASVRSRPFDQVGYGPFVVVATVLAVAATVTLFRAARPIGHRPITLAYRMLAVLRPCVAAGFVMASGAVVLSLVVLVLSVAVTLLSRRVLTVVTPHDLPVAAVETAS